MPVRTGFHQTRWPNAARGLALCLLAVVAVVLFDGVLHALMAVAVWLGIDYRNNLKAMDEWRQDKAVSQYLQPLRR